MTDSGGDGTGTFGYIAIGNSYKIRLSSIQESLLMQLYLCFVPNVLIKGFKLLLGVREASCSNFGPETSYTG